MRNKNQEIKYHGLLLLLLLAGAYCGCKKLKKANLVEDTANGLLQVKQVNDKTIVMELLPRHDSGQTNESTGKDFYKVKLVLKSKEKIKGNAFMQYMNFDIKKSFYAVQGRALLPCMICERIPGINGNEYVYMTFFNKPVIKEARDASLHLCIADTIAGFGRAAFEIRNEALKKLEVIK